MKKIILLISCALIISVLTFASACSFFGSADIVKQIERIYSSYSEEDGGTYIIIEYGGDYEDDSFFIADADAGREGTGISNITHRLNDNGTTTIIIEYSDPSKYPAEFTVPNGLYIRSILPDTDPQTGERRLTILFSDPAEEPIVLTIPSGKDGRHGDKINSIYTTEDEDGNTVVHIVIGKYDYNSERWLEEERDFTIPKSQRGSGISSVSLNPLSYSDPYSFYLDIYFEKGEITTVAIPRANSWYTGAGSPSPAQYNIGDFYFDTSGYTIYQKQQNGGWQKLVDFSAYSQEVHAVNFYIDGATYLRTEYITHGYNFASTLEAKLDSPTREGYRFLGWFTEYISPDESTSTSSPNSGQFTDLTPVMSNITLYARWQKL